MKIVRLGAKPGHIEIVENGEVIEVLFDYTLCWMVSNKIPLTKENWLALNYCGDVQETQRSWKASSARSLEKSPSISSDTEKVN